MCDDIYNELVTKIPKFKFSIENKKKLLLIVLFFEHPYYFSCQKLIHSSLFIPNMILIGRSYSMHDHILTMFCELFFVNILAENILQPPFLYRMFLTD